MPLYGEAKKAYQREWMRRRRQNWIDENGPCVDCGSDVDLEVDHVDAKTKSFNPSFIWSRKAEVREAELAKCVVRCSTCHQIKTSANEEQSRKGEYNTNKLTEVQVMEIREKYSNGGITYRDLADQYDVNFTTIGDIIRREKWKHV